MSQPGFGKTSPVMNFQGENLVISSMALPPNISPDALNTDYRRFTVRKRLGMTRLDDRPFRGGAIVASERLGNVTPFTGSGFSDAGNQAWAVQFAVRYRRLVTSGAGPPEYLYVVSNRLGALGTGDGWDYCVKFDGSVYQHAARFYTTPAAADTVVVYTAESMAEIDPGNDYNDARIWHITVEYRGDVSPKEYNLYVNGTKVSTTSLTETLDECGATAIDFGYVGGAIPAFAYVCDLDEIRLWSLTGLSGSSYTDHVTLRETTTRGRALTAAEIANANLKVYWTLNGATPLASDKGSKTITITVPATSSDDVIYVGGLVDEVGFSQQHIRKIDFLGDRGTGVYDFLIQTDYGIYWWVFDPDQFDASTTLKRLLQYVRDTVNLNPISSAPFRNKTISVKEDVKNWKAYQVSGAWRAEVLTPLAPDSSGVATADGAAGNPNGTYRFKLIFYNSADGVFSEYSSEFTHTTAGANKIDITNLPDADYDDGQVTHIDVYATKANGAVFYLADRLAINTTTYTFDKLDNQLTQIANDFVGRADAARAVVIHQDRVFLLYKDGLVRWSEFTTLDRHGAFAHHYFENFLYLSLANGDELVGGFSEGGRLVLGCRNSIWQIGGYGPSTYQPWPIYHAGGAISPNCIVASNAAVYMLSPYGMIQIPFGGQPQMVSADSFTPLFEDQDGASWQTACMAFYPVTQEVFCTFDTVNSGRITVIYNEQRQSWARWDLPIEAYCIFDPKGGAPRLLAAWRGYVVQIGSGTNDGATDAGNNTGTVTGTVTGGGDNYLVASAASFLEDSQMNPAVFNYPEGGLSGCKVEKTSGGVTEERTIGWNDGTTLYVTSNWTSNPIAGDTFRVAGIAWRWKSPKWAIEAHPASDKRTNRLFAWFRSPENVDVTLTPYMDDVADTAHTIDISGRAIEETLIAHGRELELEFSNLNPDEPVEMEAYCVEAQDVSERT